MAVGGGRARIVRNGRSQVEAREDPFAYERLLALRVVWAAVPLLLFAAALSLRIPYMMEVPGFTDETVEVQIGLDALRGRWPLVDVEPYLGSLFNYLLAVAFLLLGQHGYVGRFLVTLLGAATVVLAYFLARRLAGRTASLLASGLMATSGVHIVNGHIAWTNCTTPFFTTAAMLALVESVARGSRLLLLSAGALYGLALQTHPGVLFLAPALALYYLLEGRGDPETLRRGDAGTRGRGELPLPLGEGRGEGGTTFPPLSTQHSALRTNPRPATPLPRPSPAGRGGFPTPNPRRPTPATHHSSLITHYFAWPFLAALAALLAYGNVIAYNLQQPEAWMDAGRRTDYAYVANPTLESYLVNLQNLGVALLRMVGSSFGGGPSLAEQLAVAANLPYLVLLLVGLVYALWRRFWLPPLVVASALLMPYFNKDYTFPMATRYLGYLLPVLYLLVALPLAGILERLWRRTRRGATLFGAICAFLVILPVANLFGYYDGYLRDNATSSTILALEREVRARYQAGLISEVLLDPQLDWIFTAPGGRVLRALDFLLRVEQVPHRTLWMVPETVAQEAASVEKPVVLVMSPASRQRLGERFRLLPMEVPDEPYLQRERYWAYLLLPESKR